MPYPRDPRAFNPADMPEEFLTGSPSRGGPQTLVRGQPIAIIGTVTDVPVQIFVPPGPFFWQESTTDLHPTPVNGLGAPIQETQLMSLSAPPGSSGLYTVTIQRVKSKSPTQAFAGAHVVADLQWGTGGAGSLSRAFVDVGQGQAISVSGSTLIVSAFAQAAQFLGGTTNATATVSASIGERQRTLNPGLRLTNFKQAPANGSAIDIVPPYATSVNVYRARALSNVVIPPSDPQDGFTLTFADMNLTTLAVFSVPNGGQLGRQDIPDGCVFIFLDNSTNANVENFTLNYGLNL